jgi:hypothetical protein
MLMDVMLQVDPFPFIFLLAIAGRVDSKHHNIWYTTIHTTCSAMADLRLPANIGLYNIVFRAHPASFHNRARDSSRCGITVSTLPDEVVPASSPMQLVPVSEAIA